jgi:hypothetical protein
MMGDLKILFLDAQVDHDTAWRSHNLPGDQHQSASRCRGLGDDSGFEVLDIC